MLTSVEGAGVSLWVPLMDSPVGAACRLRIPAREVILAGKPPEAISVQNIVPGTVARIAEDQARRTALVEVALPEGALLSRVTPDAVTRLGLAPGRAVLALIKSTSIEVLGA
jgi:molybdate transport system ATP-binding protein